MGYYQKAGTLKNLSNRVSLPPSPPLSLPSQTWNNNSYTRSEIERFWRKKRLVEEDHLLHATKASARLRAIHLSEVEYRLFLESLDEIKIKEEDVTSNKEIRLGVKDWWTKSKYAYLNEPAIGTVRPSRRSNYKPNNILLCNSKLNSTSVTTASVEAPFLGVC